jgi:hypothetical protein
MPISLACAVSRDEPAELAAIGFSRTGGDLEVARSRTAHAIGIDSCFVGTASMTAAESLPF